MCLKITDDVTAELERRFEQGGGEITAYKFVTKEKDGTLRSPFHDLHVWKPGWNVSNRDSRMVDFFKESEQEDKLVELGIHVSLDPDYFPSPGRMPEWKVLVRIEVRCRREDLVAAGRWSDDGSRSAVFTKVYYPGEKDDGDRRS